MKLSGSIELGILLKSKNYWLHCGGWVMVEMEVEVVGRIFPYAVPTWELGLLHKAIAS